MDVLGEYAGPGCALSTLLETRNKGSVYYR